MLEPFLPSLLIINEIVSWYLVGFIWLVQLSIYPQLHLLLQHAPDIWHGTHQRHCGLMGFFAGGPMIAQLSCSAAFIFGIGGTLSILFICLVLATWLLTFLWSVPCHNRLGKGPDTDASRQLILSNWPRTIIWTAAAPLATWLRVAHIS